jgi:(5-formylfuran-3-yl)methyl phosphate synthase
MRVLVSVRSVNEALIAARGGADFIDLKEPSNGALGGLPVETIAAIVAALRAQGIALPVSATVGDPPRARLLAHVAAVAACGVDYVKVGIAGGAGARALLDALARCGPAVVPVFIADQGIDTTLVAHALRLRAFPALMLDTDDKRGGSLFQRVPQRDLVRFVEVSRDSGTMAGLAGALRLQDLPALAAVAPDFAGFRSAVCNGDRRAALDEGRLRALLARMPRTALHAMP